MDMSKYNRLVEYITQVGDPNNRSRAYKYSIHYEDILWWRLIYLVLIIGRLWTR